MSKNSISLNKLLPKRKIPDQDRDDQEEGPPLAVRATNAAVAVLTAVLLALVLVPRFPLLTKGEIAPRTYVAPYTMHFESPGPDGSTVPWKISRGEVIVESGSPVSDRAARALQEITRREGVGNRYAAYSGVALLILLVFYLLYRDIERYRPAFIRDWRKVFLLAFLLLGTILISNFARSVLALLTDHLPLDVLTIGFALPVSAGAMLVCLLFDFHLALAFSFVVSLFMGVLFHGDPFMPVYYFLGSLVSAFSVIQCKKRTALVRAGFLTSLMNVATVIAIDLYRGELSVRGIYDTSAAFSGAMVVSMLVSVSLPFLEAIFDITTDIKLLELLEPNQPLLKELVYKSPGTYHHSIVIGNLSEAAAESIGENPLLARVGAYYHDVGKLRKPEYFIENQRPSENKHDRLMPSMSSLIIAAHVKDGVDIAREHKLPSAVVDIIQQHHGTSLITYFYQKARELQPLVKISEGDYRYAGPRPRTKIAAIVMLSDAVEAASRTLENPTPARIQALVNSVITRIFLDDQLGKCDLTFSDLREISRSFNLTLSGIFHHRIDYPGIDFPGEKKRGEHKDKRQPEEAKASNGRAQEEAPEPAAGHWPS